jgi:lysophospholipase L1-like esterase
MNLKRRTAESEHEIPPQSPQNPRFLFVAYLFHLLLPAFLLLDVLNAWWREEVPFQFGSTEAFVGALSAVWLVIGLGGLLLSHDRRRFLKKIYKPLLTICAVYLLLIFVEVISQVFLHLTPPIPGAYTQGRSVVGPLDPRVYPGVRGTKAFTINPLGIRGPMPPKQQDHAYRIVAVGGSSTICFALDDSEEWPHLLMKEMNASQQGYPVWVGNAGVSSKNTVDHLVLLDWLPGVVRTDMLIFMVGMNDLRDSLVSDGAPTQVLLERNAGYQGELPSGTRWRPLYPYYRRLQLFRLIRLAGLALKHRVIGAPIDRGMDIDVKAYREKRAAHAIVPLPDLHVGLQEYRARLLALAARCRTLEVRCLFLTQPNMLRSGMSPSEERLLWFGYVGQWHDPTGYVSAEGLAQAMDAYNGALLDVCQHDGLECYDLASHVPKDTSAFYDGFNFNEAGAQLVAHELQRYILSKPPFLKSVFSVPFSVPAVSSMPR